MPADPSAVASVEDPELLRMAQAGANWSCAYCGSDQRDLDGACRRCGAGRAAGANAPRGAPHVASNAIPPSGGARALLIGLAAVAVVSVVGCLALVGARSRKASPAAAVASGASVVAVARTEFVARVTATSWKRTIDVEKWKLEPHEGFTADVPQGALETRAAGQKVHHHEDVFDHDETVYDEVEVPDGYRTETYSARESCGEDCTTTPRTCRKVCSGSPRTCRQVCTNNKNGFASCREQCSGGNETCRDDCSGGDRRCTTKYCSVTKTRQVPKTRTERRPRIVKRYRSEPRYAPWSTYKTWEWVTVRTAEESGADAQPRWPDAGVLAIGDAAAPRPGAEREQRREHLEVTLTTDDASMFTYVPKDEEELARITAAPSLRVRVQRGVVTILE